MKEVTYNNNLEENINVANSKFIPGGAYKKMLPAAVIALAGVFTAGGLDVISLETMAYVAAGTCAVYAGSGFVSNAISKKNHQKKVSSAGDDLFHLMTELNEKHDVYIGLRDVREAICVDKEVTTTKVEDYESKIISNEEKIIKYFYLLDDDDKIQVLKQIATSRNHNYEVADTEYETFLLEPEDLVGHEMPVRKKLVKD